MPSSKKPANENPDLPIPEHDTTTREVWAQGQVLSEEQVLSDVFALRPAHVPDDVYEFAIALNIDGSERSKREPNEPDVADTRAVVPESGSSEPDADEIIPTLEEDASAEIGRAIARLSSLREDLLRDAEVQLVELAGVIAQRVMARELQTDASFVRSLVKEGIAALAAGDRVIVRLGDAFASHRATLLQQLEAGSLKAEVIIDGELAPSGCVIETTFGRVDESLDCRLDALMNSLRAESGCD